MKFTRHLGNLISGSTIRGRMNYSPIFALVLLIAAVMVVYILRPKKEGFSSGIDKYDAMGHDEYIQLSMKKYNPLADQYDVTRPNFARTDDPVKLDQMTAQIKSAMATSEIYPDGESGSRFGVKPRDIDISLPPPNEIIGQARKCEAIKGRSCDILRNPDNRACGVCIKGGTSFSEQDKPGKHVGGLLVLPDDRLEAESKAGRGEATYAATVGECAPGYLYVSADKCEKGKNRLECDEAGVAGGFDGTMKDLARSKCAQVVDGEGSTYIYEPRGRKFRANLRVITPAGAGDIGVYILVVQNEWNGWMQRWNEQWRVIGSYIGADAGKEIVVPIGTNVGEGQELKVYIFEKFPHRPRGRSEVFQLTQENKNYGENKESSEKLCNSMGGRLATKEEVEQTQKNGAQYCGCGYTTNGNMYPMKETGWGNGNMYPMKETGWGNGGCGPRGINFCGTSPDSWNKGGGNTWCYGIKPPNSTFNTPSFSIPDKFRSFIAPFYHGSEGRIWSEFGADYQAPAYRGVIMQCESEDGMRVVPFEPTIVKVNGVGPSNESADGSKTFSNLRKQGTFGKSTMIVSPRPTGKMLKNQFWIWSNQTNNVTTEFTVKVPGIFGDPFYSEDKIVAPRGPLISTPETMKLMRSSPCLRDGELPGKYSIDCLNNLFRSSGGDPLRGKLATEGGGLTQLLKLGDMDEISGYLANLFSVATKGRDVMGNRVGSNRDDQVAKINAAAQSMFGFDLTTPCEDVVEDSTGNMSVVPKVSPYNADCLDFLWMNTGNERGRGNEDRSRNTSLSNTYTTLYDRYSGLRSGEGSTDKRKTHPFQACQRLGTKAPIGADGKPNTSAITEANTKGSMINIQNWYNTIHVQANYLPTGAVYNPTHKEYMKQCYGINRVDNVPGVQECDAVSARYVRVLATAIYGSTNPQHACMQIPQLQVFDARDNEVARDKPTSSNTIYQNNPGYGRPQFAVNGNAKPHSHGEGEYHDDCSTPDRQFWMVDLGSTMRISRVVFYPRTDCCDYRQNAAPVQLLDESKKIVAQRWIGQNGVAMNQVQNLIFSSDMSKPIIPTTQYHPGMRVSLMSATSHDRFLSHMNFAIWASGTGGRTPQTMDPMYRNNSTFTLQSARNGIAGVSFESVNYPGHFLRHAGFRCWLQPGSSQLDNDDSSFYTVAALNGDPSMVSFKSSNFPSYYLATKRENPAEVWITTVDTSNVWDVQRASWKLIPGLA
jgi:hypothetical protein